MADLPPLKDPKAEAKPFGTEMPVLNADLGEPAAGSKDVMIGAGGLLVLALLFFFIRGAYVNYLVGSMKRSPNNAGLAGWGLFGCLFFGAAIGCVALVGKSFLTLAVIVPLAALSLVCLILCLVVSGKK
jgi:hypothetical protein